MIQVHEDINGQLAGDVRAYLAAAPPESGVCAEHDPRWLSVLRDALGQKPRVLISRQGDSEEGAIDGYLPLALVSTHLFGRFLVSLPYLNRAGVVATDDAVRQQLIDRAVALAEESQAKYLELRHHDNATSHKRFDFERGEKQRMVLTFPGDEDDLWKLIGPKVRNQVRKGDKFDLKLRWGTGPSAEAELDAFYDVFAVNMRDLGTPVYGKALFRRVLAEFADQAELAVVDYEGLPIAGALIIHDGGGPGRPSSTQVPSASSLREHNKTNANMWMYHHLLLRAMERGSAEFDFGRSSEGSGTYRFKKQWGAEPRPTTWQYVLLKGDADAMRPDDPRNQKKIEMWKKLPVWLTRLVGPAIVRGIP